MNCRSAESLFSAFLDDELTQAERRDFESHLLGCRRCSQSLRELKGALALVLDASVATAVEPSPHFEDDVMDRIRSGEAMRPSVVEWLQSLLTPERLRPVFVTGAAACALAVAVILWPHGGADKAGETGNGGPQVAAVPSTSPEAAPSVPTGDRTASTTPIVESPSVVASAPARSNAVPRQDAGGNGIVEIADRVVPATQAGLDSTIPNPNSQFMDEYVTDHFYLQRGNTATDPQQPSLVPVTDKTAHDVYIEF